MIEEVELPSNERDAAPAGRTSGHRRGFLARALGLGAGAVGLAHGGRPAEAWAQQPGVDDIGILQFALNLEYLEAEFYTYAVAGTGIAAQGIPTSGSGASGPTTVKSNPAVPFVTPIFQQFAMELAIDEQKHVLYLRNAITSLGGQPIAKPAIDLLNSFNLASQMAGLGATFDPYANETNFLLGSYIFEDVGVTAYHGASPLIKNKAVLAAAAGVYAVEGYHAGTIRTFLAQLGQGAATDAISNVRQQASGVTDYGVDRGSNGAGPAGTTSIILDDAQGRSFARTFRQVLNVVYLAAGAASGGFFPNGVNGTIRS